MHFVIANFRLHQEPINYRYGLQIIQIVFLPLEGHWLISQRTESLQRALLTAKAYLRFVNFVEQISFVVKTTIYDKK